MMSSPRWVVDTNTIVSALLFTNSVPRQALDWARHHGIILQSRQTIEELNDVLRRRKFDRYISEVERLIFLEAFILAAELVEVIQTIRIARDPKDDKFLELAVNGNADAILTGDDDLLTLTPYAGIIIMTPRRFIDVYSV